MPSKRFSTRDLKMSRILLAVKEEISRKFVSSRLREYGNIVDESLETSEALHKAITEGYDLIIEGLDLPVEAQFDFLKKIKSSKPDVEVILITGSGTIQSAIEAMRAGAFDYVSKPIYPDELLVKAERALEHRRINKEIQHLQDEFQKAYGLGAIIAESEEMRKVLHLASQVAKSSSPILIQGESGTGKELVAKAIHCIGRSGKPFVPINCGAIPETLLESELFGHIHGSFTGSVVNKKGLFEEAHNGTLFIDEIGDMPTATQVKLLRALDFGEIRRIGSNIPIYVNARIIAATNKDLQLLVSNSKFREDLFYRLNVVSIHIPPLRKRRSDIMPLAEFFLNKYGRLTNKNVCKISAGVRQIFLRYDWPGNVRELENVIERAVVLAHGDTITEEELPSNMRSEFSDILRLASSEKWSLKKLEQEYMLKLLNDYDNNRSELARRLGIGRNTLWRKLKSYNA